MGTTNSDSKYGNIYVDRAIDFLRGESGHYLIFGHRAWLPEGTTFDRWNAEMVKLDRARLDRALEKNDIEAVRKLADDILKGRQLETPIGEGSDSDADQWRRVAEGEKYPKEFGRRFLLISCHGEEQMWVQSYDTQSVLCCAIADLIGDRDYGFAAAVDLDTFQMFRPEAVVTLIPVHPGPDAEYQQQAS